MNCHCNQCECERQEPPKEEQHTLTFRRHEITLIKNAPDRNWYIRVRSGAKRPDVLRRLVARIHRQDVARSSRRSKTRRMSDAFQGAIQ